VDSAVAMHLLLREGRYEVKAFYLKIWLEDEDADLGTCPWEEDIAVCRDLCHNAGVPLEVVSLQKEYHREITKRSLDAAREGRTPNPDVACNSRIKFGVFAEHVREFDYVASGHYASVRRGEKGYELWRAPDAVKDQSYFLCTLNQKQLSRALFPLGNLQKTEVRRLAKEEFRLVNADRKDSQGLCFLGKIPFETFLRQRFKDEDGRGEIREAVGGTLLGHHHGLWCHTVGQRKGLGKVMDPKQTSKGPWYVVAKDLPNKILLVSNDYDRHYFDKARTEFWLEDVQWIAGDDLPPSSHRFFFKIRHGPRIARGSLFSSADGAARVVLDAKDGGLAPGQYVAFYRMVLDDAGEEFDTGECLGSGIIGERHWVEFLADRGVHGKVERQAEDLQDAPL